MQLISRLEQDSRLDKLVSAGQRAARLIRPGKGRDGLHGVWLGHPLHPLLVQASVGTWLSASILDLSGGGALRLAGLAVVSASGLAGGHISFRLAGGANHAEPVPHLVEPGWHHLAAAADLPESIR